MMTYDQDPDVVRWGLHLLDGLSTSNYEYCENDARHSISNSCNEEYGSCTHFSVEHPVVENDEILAHALQEELAELAVAESSGSPPAGEEHLQASILAQDWLCPSRRDFGSTYESGQEAADNMGLSSSCSSPEQKLYEEEECLSLELTDEYSALDGEVGKRLNQMVPIAHVPRINGEIPSADEEISDHQRLLDRLQLYDLVELKMDGDGNCQFRALSDQFYRAPEHHKFVRRQVVNQLMSYPENYEGYVPMAYDEYLKKISRPGEWGDHVTLQAAADSYGVKILVLTSFKDTCYIEILPNVQKSKRVIFLSFWAEVHYNSIYPAGDMPIVESKKKKKWWPFGHKH